MLVPPGLRLVGAYAAASEESPAKLAALARQLGELLPPHLVCDRRFVVPLADVASVLQHSVRKRCKRSHERTVLLSTHTQFLV